MTQPSRPDAAPPTTDVAEVRELLDRADRQLLGATIAVTDQDWRSASALPGWTRGHVATHLSRHADAFARLASGARAGTDEVMYPGDRDAEIEQGADRSGLEIQTDLDTSVGRLEQEFEQLAEADGWQTPVQLRHGIRVAAEGLPLGRLFEVVVHHVDLDIGMTVDDIDPALAEHCLRWAAIRQGGRTDYPALRLTCSDGGSGAEVTVDVGATQSADPIVVSGPANRLLGWLTQRSGAEGLRGDVPTLPTFG
ncbi:maleylpyruvate isomerase family mycothiol-dependent enzyme [Microlunatus soli]|uniref:Maleylpyruvate isomerase n=1 Tax=Microlunatus soli TaxID=630515 RepID=A0A1H1P870_9ACTN|nr:maleylpyruvate isomerase family mycothiol-dependent enzyme [Microlunatus soli]SDS07392.1 maleylpyruvate isomerase [Microlunatus soli]